jgi:hypothetical protein
MSAWGQKQTLALIRQMEPQKERELRLFAQLRAPIARKYYGWLFNQASTSLRTMSLARP